MVELAVLALQIFEKVLNPFLTYRCSLLPSDQEKWILSCATLDAIENDLSIFARSQLWHHLELWRSVWFDFQTTGEDFFICVMVSSYRWAHGRWWSVDHIGTIRCISDPILGAIMMNKSLWWVSTIFRMKEKILGFFTKETGQTFR